MSTIDLRQLGPITASDELYLSRLIACACFNDNIKHYLSLRAKEDFGWDNMLMMPYLLAGLLSDSTSRINDFLSSSEWLCGIFVAGDWLSIEHVRIMMNYINPYTAFNTEYISGKDCWDDASPILKTILDILDDCVINKNIVFINCPIIVSIDPRETLEELAILPYNLLKEKILIRWES